MQGIFFKAGKNDIGICIDILYSSEVGTLYYPTITVAKNALLKGINEDELWVLLDEDNHYIGYIWYQINGAFHIFPYLHEIIVVPEKQGKGFGKQLLAFFETTVLESKNSLRTKAFLLVNADNINAQKFYEKSGYKQLVEIENLYRKNNNEILLMKEISKI